MSLIEQRCKHRASAICEPTATKVFRNSLTVATNYTGNGLALVLDRGKLRYAQGRRTQSVNLRSSVVQKWIVYSVN